MKTEKYILLALSFPLFTSCFHDEGNYNYSDPLNIQVAGIKEQYTVSVGDVIKLHPDISPADRQYDCFWTIALSNAQAISAVDTISKEKDWEYTVDRNIGAYKLRFCAKDVQTGIFAYKEYLVNVTTDMATGWWILKSDKEETETDFDFFSSSDKRKENILFTTNGSRMKGKPLNLFFTNTFWRLDQSTQRDVRTNAVFAASTEDIVAIDYFTGKILSKYEDLFVDKPVNRKVHDMFAGPSDVHVYVDSVVYTMLNATYAVYKQFVIKTLGDYKLSPHKHSTHLTFPLLFDEKKSSFCSVSRNSTALISFTNNSFLSPNNMNMDLIFLGGKTVDPSRPGDKAFAIMKKKESDEYQLLTMNGMPQSTNPIEENKTFNNLLKVLHADFRTLNQNNNIIYFSKDNKLFACNLDTQTESEQSIALPAGEEITYMEYLKYCPYGLNDSWFDYLAIATVKGENYKLYLHEVNAGEVKEAKKILEGKGRVKRACYMEQSKNGIFTTTLF
ncbi:PKD-like family lipoprotein [Bacteroides sp. KG123]|uniref:PKD-like family lipoprotein n=1 Tax=unclassified Bacteroides TaxID=2646097 RepID=UPI003D7FFEA1